MIGSLGPGCELLEDRLVLSPPTTIGIPNVTVNEDAANTVFNLRLYFSDADTGAASLTYTVQSNSNPDLFTSITIIDATDVIGIDYAPNAFGSANLKTRGTAPDNEFVETTFTVTANPINDAPTLTNPETSVMEGLT